VEVTLPEPVSEEVLIAEDIPLDILFEDDHIVVINKPPRMVIYPAAGNMRGTMMNALAFHCRSLATVGAPLRPGVVHRLDQDTSGVIVVAKTDDAYHNMVSQFRDRETEKQYLALIFGKMKKDQGMIHERIGRSSTDRKKMTTRTRHGKEAVTQYDVIDRYRSASLVKVRILTGRTHQIRVHFSAKGHPVLGDHTYGKKTELRLGQKVVTFARQMLHAYSLTMTHPATGRIMEFIAPMPEDMKKAIETLKDPP
jgi:23S rRNA pseudouridine1911/1915/1917 synthase